MGVLLTFCLNWPQTTILPISTSHSDPLCPAPLYIFSYLKAKLMPPAAFCCSRAHSSLPFLLVTSFSNSQNTVLIYKDTLISSTLLYILYSIFYTCSPHAAQLPSSSFACLLRPLALRCLSPSAGALYALHIFRQRRSCDRR
jgi:hypothetical protein